MNRTSVELKPLIAEAQAEFLDIEFDLPKLIDTAQQREQQAMQAREYLDKFPSMQVRDQRGIILAQADHEAKRERLKALREELAAWEQSQAEKPTT